MSRLDFGQLDATGFEEFCFELLQEVGFVNVDWRKGTGLSSSPSDRGRDIVAQLERTDIDGSRHLETWFVDCKHYQKGVPPEHIQGLLAWANAERPQTALIVASNFLSNPCKDFLKDYEANNRPPFRVKYWERPMLERMTVGHDEFLRSHLFSIPRSQEELLGAEQEFFDQVWYARSMLRQARMAKGDDATPQDIIDKMLEARADVERRYGKDQLGPYDDFDWGMLNGKLSALRWVLGDEWDMLDT